MIRLTAILMLYRVTGYKHKYQVPLTPQVTTIIVIAVILIFAKPDPASGHLEPSPP